MGSAGFDVQSAFAIGNGAKFNPELHMPQYPGDKFAIVLRILARDQEPVILEARLAKAEISSGKKLRFLPRPIKLVELLRVGFSNYI
jgi:hypothetical protein